MGWSCLTRAGCIGGGLTADSLNRHIVPSLPRVPPGHFLTRRVLDELMSEAWGGRAWIEGGRRPARPRQAGPGGVVKRNVVMSDAGWIYGAVHVGLAFLQGPPYGNTNKSWPKNGATGS